MAAWWPAESSYLDTVTGLPGTPHNGATFRPGVDGNGFDLSADGSHIRVPDTAALRFQDAFTIEVWVNPQDFPFNWFDRSVAGRWDAVLGFDRRSYNLSLSADNVPYLIVSPDGAESDRVLRVYATNSLAWPGVWTHVAATYDGEEIRIHVNGVLGGTATVWEALITVVDAGADFQFTDPEPPTTLNRFYRLRVLP